VYHGYTYPTKFEEECARKGVDPSTEAEKRTHERIRQDKEDKDE